VNRASLIVVRIIAAIVVAPVLIAGAALIWTAGTEGGLQFVWQRVVPKLSDAVTIDAVEGRIAGPLVVRGVELRTPTLQLSIERAEVEWRLLALLRGSLSIERLRLSGVDVTQLPAESVPPDPAEAFALPERIELPLEVQVAQASLEQLRYRSAPDAEALLIERVEVETLLDRDEWALRELTLRSPLFDVTARASIAPHGDYETEGELDWVLRPGAYPVASGSTRFSGSLQALAIEERIDAPYNARADVVVRQPFSGPSLDGDLTLTVNAAELGSDLPSGSIASNVSFEGTLERLVLTGKIELSSDDFGRADVDLRAEYADGALQIEKLEVAHPASGAALHASGELTLEAQPALDLRATWSGLRWPLHDAPRVMSDTGTLELEGKLDEYRLALEAELALSDDANGRVRVDGTGGMDALDLEHIEVEALQGRIAGRGNITWRPALGAAIELTGDDLNPGVLASEWPGQLDAELRVAGTVDGQDLSAQVDHFTVNGRLRDRSIDANARGAYSGDTLRLETLSLQSGETAIDASGTVGRAVALQWRIDSPDLGDLWSRLSGQLAASGKLQGPRLQPQVAVVARGQALKFLDAEVGELELTADVDVAGAAPSRLDLALRSANVQGTAIQELALSGDGNGAHHELTLRATTDFGAAEIALTGGIAQPWKRDFLWSFVLDTATLAPTQFSPWTLREPSHGRIGAAQTELEETCWQSDPANLCIEGSRRGDRTTAGFALSELPFGYFASLLADGVQLEGVLDVEGTFAQQSGGAPRVNLNMTSSPARIASAQADAGEHYALAFGPVDGRVTTEDDGIAGVLRVPFEQLGQLEIQARVGAGASSFAERSLDGSLAVEIGELDFLPNVVSELQNTKGTLTGDARLSGTVGEPRVAGRLALDNGAATVGALNVVLEDLGLALASDGNGEITVAAQARSGGGSVNAEGRFALAAAGSEGRVAVTGRGFEVINTRDARVLVSPDLELVLAPDRLALTGSVDVPEARLTPREAEGSVVAASADQVIVTGEERDDRPVARPFYADVELELGDEVHLDGYGLTGRLDGAIEITEMPGEPVTGSGEVRVEKGVYEAYGQKLEIRTGRLLFAGGPVEQPGLDVEAVRRPKESILVGARVRGTLEAPKLSVFSEPAMPQQDQLSYLVLGRPLESASASESSAMSRAALALGLKGGNFVSDRINKNLGLDEFGIQTDPGEPASEASFVIGKYLTPSLYVSYGVGLFEPVNTLKLRYTISGRWQLVTESSSVASSGDLIYNIERGD
jgi:translocation and assembly module TamB